MPSPASGCGCAPWPAGGCFRTRTPLRHRAHRQLGWLDRVISPEPVLTAEVRRLVDAVAARYAGTRPDVLRLAIPPRHARGREKVSGPRRCCRLSTRSTRQGGPANGGAAFLEALAEGRAARAVAGAAGRELVRPARRGGRLRRQRWASASSPWCPISVISTRCGRRPPRVDASAVVALSAGLGPSARYRRWLSVLRGEAAWSSEPAVRCSPGGPPRPGDDLGRRRRQSRRTRAPYPHARDVGMLRAHQLRCAAIIGVMRVPPRPRRWSPVAGAQPGGPRPVVRSSAPGWSPSTTTASPTNAIPPPHRSAAVDGAAGGPAATLERGAPVLVQVPRRGCRRSPAPGVAPSRAAGTAWDLCRCPTATPRGGMPVVRPDRQRTALPALRGDSIPARSWSAPGAPPRNSPRLSRNRRDHRGRRLSIRRSTQGRPWWSPPRRRAAGTRGLRCALLLDTLVTAGPADLRTAEDTLRRWMAAAAQVHSAPGRRGGRRRGSSSIPPVQALIRWDPVGHAEAEFDGRTAVGLPPAVHMAAAVDGPPKLSRR